MAEVRGCPWPVNLPLRVPPGGEPGRTERRLPRFYISGQGPLRPRLRRPDRREDLPEGAALQERGALPRRLARLDRRRPPRRAVGHRRRRLCAPRHALAPRHLPPSPLRPGCLPRTRGSHLIHRVPRTARVAHTAYASLAPGRRRRADLNPADVDDFGWPYVTPGYILKYLRNIDWGVVDDKDRRRLAARKRARAYEREPQGSAGGGADDGGGASPDVVDFKWGHADSAPPRTTASGAHGPTRVWRASPD